MDQEALSLLMDLVAKAGKDPTGPATAAALLFFVMFILTKAPVVSDFVKAKLLTTDKARRIAAAVMAAVPALASILAGALAWDRALLTAVFSFVAATGAHYLFTRKEES